MQIDKSNTQLKLSVTELKLKLRSRDKEMQKEMQKVSTYLTLRLSCNLCILIHFEEEGIDFILSNVD